MKVLGDQSRLYAAIDKFGGVYIESIEKSRESVIDYINSKHSPSGWDGFLEKGWRVDEIFIRSAKHERQNFKA